VSPTAETVRPSFWQRRVRDPIIALFTQGITPDKVALTLAVGAACSLFPFLGFTSLLNLGIGLWLRMNQPILQTLNQLLGPVQLVMIVAYVRLGEWVWQAQDGRFTIAEMLRIFREASLGEFFGRFGWAGVHAFTAWALSTPLLITAVYYVLRPALRRLAKLTTRS
jgi:uncharacterized protein (DUF2062 family)